MASAWEFVKRHRGKIIFSGLAAGGAFLVQQAMERRRGQEESTMATTTTQMMNDVDALQLQARRHYVFDSNQRTCDNSVIELIPSIEARIQLRFDVDGITERLKRDGASLSAEQKIALWQEIKVMAVSRILAVAYSYSLLAVALKCQISMVAAEICSSFTKPSTMNDSSWWSTYVPSQLKVWLSSSNNDDNNRIKPSVRSCAQQLFLQCIQYLTTKGLDQLFDRIETVTRETMDPIGLKTEINLAKLKSLLNDLRCRIEGSDRRNFSYLVVPMAVNQESFALPHRGHLMAMLNRLVEMIESGRGNAAMTEMTDTFVNAFIETMTSRLTDGVNNGGVPLAQSLPVISDCFYLIAGVDFDSPLQTVLASPILHQLAMHVFNLPLVDNYTVASLD